MPLPSYAPPDTEIARPFWEGVERRELVLPRCSVCGSFEWYPSDAGPCCPDGRYEWMPVAGTGTVFTWTRVVRRFLPSGGEPPYVVGLIELDGTGGIRLVAAIDAGESDPVIGGRVRVTFAPVEGGTRPVFVPTDDVEQTRRDS